MSARGDDVAGDVLLQLALPVPADGAGDVTLLVGGGVNIDLNQADIGVAAVFGYPIGSYQRFRMCVISHIYTSYVAR